MIKGAHYTLTGSGTSNLGWPEIALRERRVAYIERYTNSHGNACDGYVYEWVIETFDGERSDLAVIAESELVEELISGTYQYNRHGFSHRRTVPSNVTSGGGGIREVEINP